MSAPSDADFAIQVRDAGSITHQAAGHDKLTPWIDRRYRMAGRKGDELTGSVVEKCIIGDKKCSSSQFGDPLERCVDLAFGTGVQNMNYLTQNACRRLHVL